MYAYVIPTEFNHRLCNFSANHRICQNSFNTFQSILHQHSYKHLFYSVLLNISPPYSLLPAIYYFERFIYSSPTIQLVINDFLAKENLHMKCCVRPSVHKFRC